jgi:hypothetical protein
MSKYALENYEYIKGLHKRIAELEADKAELVEGLKCAEHFSTCLLNYCGHATTEEDDNTLYSMDLLITKHQQPEKEQGE